MHRAIVLLCLAASLLLAGCAGPGQGSDTETPIEMTLETDRDTIQAGQWVNLSVVVENVSDEPYTYDHPGCPPEPIEATVQHGGDGIRLYEYGSEPMAGACAIKEVTLEPGQKLEATMNWNGHTQGAQPDPHDGDPVAAGDHTVEVELARADGGPTFTHTVTITVQG